MDIKENGWDHYCYLSDSEDDDIHILEDGMRFADTVNFRGFSNKTLPTKGRVIKDGRDRKLIRILDPYVDVSAKVILILALSVIAPGSVYYYSKYFLI